jgi:hypothetical protein
LDRHGAILGAELGPVVGAATSVVQRVIGGPWYLRP